MGSGGLVGRSRFVSRLVLDYVEMIATPKITHFLSLAIVTRRGVISIAYLLVTCLYLEIDSVLALGYQDE